MMTSSVLEEEYVNRGLTDLQISLKYGVDRTYISKLRKEHSISTRETTGTKGESIVIKELLDNGFEVKNINDISMTFPYDLLVNKHLRVDVKSATLSKDNFFRFSLTDKKESNKIESDTRIRLANGRTRKLYGKTCDYIILACIVNGEKYCLFYVPSHLIPNNQQTISIPLSLSGKYSAYKDKRDFLMDSFKGGENENGESA